MDVTPLQIGLAQLGGPYDPGPIDGKAGPRTWGAVGRLLGDQSTPAIGPALARALQPKWGLDDKASVINFLANVAHESGFWPVEENLNYSAERLTVVWPSRFPTLEAAEPFAYFPAALADRVYGGRMGNSAPGDAYRFRGRAWPQLTGRDAYRAVGLLLGVDLEADPDWCTRTLENCALTAAAFWKWKGIEAVSYSPRIVRLRWNGGTVGLQQVLDLIDRLEKVWA